MFRVGYRLSGNNFLMAFYDGQPITGNWQIEFATAFKDIELLALSFFENL